MSKEKLKLATNAPAEWPDVEISELVPERHREDYVSNVNKFNLALAAAFDGHPALELKEIAHCRMLEEGILEVPFEIVSEDHTFGLFLFSDACSASAAAFKGVQNIYNSWEEHTAIYYSPGPLKLSNGPELSPLRPFAFDIFLKLSGEAATPGEYAMWWPENEEDRFCNSETHCLLNRIYAALDGIETYVNAMLLHNLDVLEEHEPSFRVSLPQQPANIPILGPDGLPMLLSLSHEKGIRFLMHREQTAPACSKLFLKHLAEFVERIREDIVHHQMRLDEASVAVEWFKSSVETIRLQESSGGELDAFGVVRVGSQSMTSE
ncbi:MAG: hypothetical protein O2857_15990 [Planctomycetota bacterium]|nr:hypothetical protein [Planctomycetota bacterium]